MSIEQTQFHLMNIVGWLRR